MGPKTKETTLAVRQIIINLFKKGKTCREIGSLIGKSHSTIGYIIKKFKKDNTIENKPRIGRPKKLTDREKKFIIRQAKINPRVSAPSLVKTLKTISQKTVTPQTIRNVLKEAGFHGRVARKKPWINKVNRSKRLKFANEYVNKSQDFWNRVIFTDESKFNLFCSDGRQMVWRKVRQEMNKVNLMPTIKHGGGSVMVWGCMAASGVGNLQIIDGILNRFGYLNILKLNLADSAEKLGLQNNFLFQQDNDPKHTARIIREWILYNTPKYLQTPPQSPDLNPIEHLWQEIKVRMKYHQTKNRQDYIQHLREEWNKIQPEVTKKLVESMPRRLKEVIRLKGYPTKY